MCVCMRVPAVFRLPKCAFIPSYFNIHVNHNTVSLLHHMIATDRSEPQGCLWFSDTAVQPAEPCLWAVHKGTEPYTNSALTARHETCPLHALQYTEDARSYIDSLQYSSEVIS